MPVNNIIPGQRVKKEKLERARELRREMTPAEKILWQELRGNKLGVHFAPCPLDIPPFSHGVFCYLVDFKLRKWGDKRGADFYCHKAGLVIELDGSIHDEDEQKESDIKRD